MEPFHNKRLPNTKAFFTIGILFLLSALLFGLLAGIQYILPGWGREIISFEKLRPLHVSSAVFWILMAAMGGVLSYLNEYYQLTSKKISILIKIQFYLFTSSFVAILISYVFGIFGGREYWEFHPLFSIPILIGWILFIVNFFTYFKTLKNQPIYIWMWLTGVVFFLFTYIESNLWLIPGIGNHLVQDMTIQWKSYGSMVGSWNMLIYGSSIYLMDKISGNQKYSHSNMAFFLYGLSLFNLMFNWGHHIYTLPTASYVKYIAYIVSMTELYILGRIIWGWRKSLTEAQKYSHLLAYNFLFAADAWVFANLGLAIVMSVPAFNIFMHGTHIIVGHTMGTTIGINTMLLLAFAYDVLLPSSSQSQPISSQFRLGYRMTNFGLAMFIMTLIVAGILKTYWQLNEPDIAYGEIMSRLRAVFVVFYASGLAVVVGFCILILPLLKVNFSKKHQ